VSSTTCDKKCHTDSDKKCHLPISFLSLFWCAEGSFAFRLSAARPGGRGHAAAVRFTRLPCRHNRCAAVAHSLQRTIARDVWRGMGRGAIVEWWAVSVRLDHPLTASAGSRTIPTCGSEVLEGRYDSEEAERTARSDGTLRQSSIVPRTYEKPGEQHAQSSYSRHSRSE